MSNEHKIDWLNRFCDALNEECRQNLAWNDLYLSALPGSPNYDGIPKGTGDGGLDVWAAKMEVVRQAAAAANVKAWRYREEIEAVVTGMSALERSVIEFRYIHLKPVTNKEGQTVRYIHKEWSEIAEILQYSESHIKNVHGEALDCFEVRTP